GPATSRIQSRSIHFPYTTLFRSQQLVGVNLPESGEIFEDCRHGPGGQIDFGFDAARQHARQISGNAAAGDVREGGNPAFRNDARSEEHTSDSSHRTSSYAVFCLK